ncbi:hypothetical protein ACGFXC_23695 [Streptomyces sp. NPDC048507]|uniref:COG1470 family protein n=1 Tax=Streptomyces sp. NPDC048507 TaxID=3365560 RepID=UPI003717C011
MRVLHTLQRLGAVLLAAAALHGAPTAAAAADEPGWSAGPAAGRPGTPRPYFYLAGPAGAVLEDRVALTNTADRERVLTLRGADAYNTPDGALAVRPAGRTADAGSWISFGGSATVTVPARTRAVIPFTVTVPPGAQPGDHPAAVVAAESGHEAAVRVHLRVGGPALAALTVEDVSVRGRGAAAAVAYTLVNRGNVALTPGLELRAEGRFGALPGRAARVLPVELLPGQRVRLTEPWPGAPALDRVAFTLTVTAPGAAPATAHTTAWFLPGGAAARTGAGLLALGAAAGAAVLLRSRRRAARRRAGGPPPGGAPERAHDGPVSVSVSASASASELTGAPR